MDSVRDDPFVVVAYGLDESSNKAWGPIWDAAAARAVAADASQDPAFLVVRIHDWGNCEDTTVVNRCPHPAERVSRGVCQVCGALA